MTRIQIIRGGEVLAGVEGKKEAQLLYQGAYQIGDEIRFETDYEYAIVQVDQAVKPARVYLPEKAFTFRLPLDGDNPAVYAPGAFAGDMHLCSIRPDEDNGYRNLARNPADQRGDVTCYPHATANVETRNESVFCARNTIDGEHIACGHGEWPFGSWGIGARTDAELTLDFGREVEVDKMVLYLRADFPHDAYWIQGTVLLGDGAEITFPLEGIDGPQEIDLGIWHRIRSLKLYKLIKCDNPSAFPSLRQIEVYGRDAER
ncbi:MAG: carbohydrate-binding protein [Clostridiales bacterium]|nr:carbohydrate-binding protein [Clostridiales bacterium]